MRLTRMLLGICLLGIFAIPVAKADDTVDDLEQWTMVTLDTHIAPKVRIYAEVQPRFSDDISQLDRLLLRTAVGYQATKSMSLWQGYAWTPVFESLNVDTGDFRENYTNENRLYQQVLFENQWQKLKVTNRTRLEERFIQNVDDTSYRVRHMLRLAYPVTKSQKLSLVGYDELFMNLNNAPGGPGSGFDQNRIFVGFNRKLTDHVNAELGYMNNLVNVFNHTTNRVNHVILATLNFKF